MRHFYFAEPATFLHRRHNDAWPDQFKVKRRLILTKDGFGHPYAPVKPIRTQCGDSAFMLELVWPFDMLGHNPQSMTGRTMPAGQPFIVYGASGSGSVPIEAALGLLDLPHTVVECLPWEGPEEAEKLSAINPMVQVPAIALPSGAVMTESAAILIWLADSHPEGRLAPGLADPARPDFIRWMTFVSSAIYSLYWITDNPSRVLEDADGHDEIRSRLYERIARCWAFMGEQLRPERYILGQDLSVLDLYVATASRWSPGRRRFYEMAPLLADVVRRVDAEPRLARFWAERFPFVDGWER